MGTISKYMQAEGSAHMNSIEKQLDQILDEFNGKLNDAVGKVTKKVAAETVKELRATSPKAPGGGEYAKGWARKKDGKGIVVYNKTHYQLTHLLENGHIVQNQHGKPKKKGKMSRVKAIPHIAPVEKKMNEKYVKDLRKAIEK